MGSELQRYGSVYDKSLHYYVLAPQDLGDYITYEDHADRIAELEAEALRFYNADGTFEVCASAEEVVERRKAAAARIAELEAELDKPCGDCEAVQQCGHHQIHEKSASGIDNNGMEQCADWCEVCDEQIGSLQARVAELESERDELLVEVHGSCDVRGLRPERDALTEKLAVAVEGLKLIASTDDDRHDLHHARTTASVALDQMRSAPGDTWEYLWSFDLNAYRKHDGPCLVALWVCSSFTGKTDWHVHLADIDDRGNLCDPDSGDDIGWRPEDVTAWKPCDITPPGIAPEAEVEPDSGQEVKCD